MPTTATISEPLADKPTKKPFKLEDYSGLAVSWAGIAALTGVLCSVLGFVWWIAVQSSTTAKISDLKAYATKEEMTVRFDVLDKKIDALDKKTDQHFDAFEKKSDQRFDDVNKRFDTFDKRFDDLNKRFDDLKIVLLKH